ncbi:MAG: hypothetical protein HY800_06520 [Ignavibacteriales bacterium]|nr:hypothetical protein [Ignavibacteriales bacterium]
MGGYVQYRVYIKDNFYNTSDSFAVIGTSSGDVDKITRKHMLDRANINAVYNFKLRFLNWYTEKFNISLPSKTEDASKKNEARVINLQPLNIP